MGSISGKKILFIAPQTFGYEKAIVSALEQMGAEVTFHGQLPSDRALVKTFFRVFPKLMWRYSDRYFISWLDNSCPKDIDIVFVVKGEGLSPKFLRYLKNHYPSARMVLYLWDSIENCKHIHSKFPYFDDIASFDPLDCQNNKVFKYRPLFFLDKYLERNLTLSAKGVFFIGTLNGDRPKVISNILKAWEIPVQFDYYLFVRNRLELKLRMLVDKSFQILDQNRLIFEPMKSTSIVEKYNKCCAVLDIEHQNQAGLTMRTFEVLASGKKLITTNKNIGKHEFFDPARILVIDRDNPVVPESFFKLPIEKISEGFINKYSIGGWIADILER